MSFTVKSRSSSDDGSGWEILPPASGFETPATHYVRLRPSAAFVAQLITANENGPQQRQGRRREPGIASSAYETADALQALAQPAAAPCVTLKIV